MFWKHHNVHITMHKIYLFFDAFYITCFISGRLCLMLYNFFYLVIFSDYIPILVCNMTRKALLCFSMKIEAVTSFFNDWNIKIVTILRKSDNKFKVIFFLILFEEKKIFSFLSDFMFRVYCWKSIPLSLYTFSIILLRLSGNVIVIVRRSKHDEVFKQTINLVLCFTLVIWEQRYVIIFYYIHCEYCAFWKKMCRYLFQCLIR